MASYLLRNGPTSFGFGCKVRSGGLEMKKFGKYMQVILGSVFFMLFCVSAYADIFEVDNIIHRSINNPLKMLLLGGALIYLSTFIKKDTYRN